MIDLTITVLEFGRDFAGGISVKTAKPIIEREIPHWKRNGRIFLKRSDALAWRDAQLVQPEAISLKMLLTEALNEVRAKRRRAS